MTMRLAALAALDAVLIGVSALAGLGPGWTLAAHALLTVLAYAILLRGGGAIRFAPVVLGVFGPIGLLLAMPLARRDDRRTARTDEAIFGPAPQRIGQRGASLAAARMLDGRVHHAGPETLDSLVTILRHGEVAARRQALETIVRSFEPALSPLIALALTDGDQTIRALAAAASSRVAQNLLVTRARLTDQDTDPETAADLAALLADHARADVLLSDSQRGHLRQDALTLLPADDPARPTLAIEALWAAGDYAAIDALAAAPAPASAVASWWHAEAAA